jgi:hypothetical protein
MMQLGSEPRVPLAARMLGFRRRGRATTGAEYPREDLRGHASRHRPQRTPTGASDHTIACTSPYAANPLCPRCGHLNRRARSLPSARNGASRWRLLSRLERARSWRLHRRRLDRGGRWGPAMPLPRMRASATRRPDDRSRPQGAVSRRRVSADALPGIASTRLDTPTRCRFGRAARARRRGPGPPAQPGEGAVRAPR